MVLIEEQQLLAWLSMLLMPLFRLLGLFTAAPVLSARAVPARFRVLMALVLAILAAPLARTPPPSLDDPEIWALLASEVMIGLGIGLVSRMMLAAVEMAGEVIGLQMGLSFAAFFDPGTGSNTNAIGRLFNAISIASFVVIGGPSLLVAVTIRSIEQMPAADGTGQFLARVDIGAVASHVFELGLLLALPYMALLLFTNLSLGIVSRVAPQLNVFAIGFPITISAGLLLLTLGMPLLLQPIGQVHQALFAIIGF